MLQDNRSRPESLSLSLFLSSTLIKISYNNSDSIESEIALQREALRQGMEAVDPNTVESFITVYGFLCDLHGVPYLEEISSVSV